MVERPCTLARWHVMPGHETTFSSAWQDLAAVFLSLKVPLHWAPCFAVSRIPRLFSSFGPWPSMETIATMRAHPGASEAIGTLGRDERGRPRHRDE